ncbi:MAG: hypothetical protein J0H31_11235, partial [Alphaproteobacteria bacterium]|nr:hypothetical protein [Alphaproteobacteria bacterium]
LPQPLPGSHRRHGSLSWDLDELSLAHCQSDEFVSAARAFVIDEPMRSAVIAGHVIPHAYSAILSIHLAHIQASGYIEALKS